MKQKILDIMDDKIFTEYYGVHGKGAAAEEIAQMMCDREASILLSLYRQLRKNEESALIATKESLEWGNHSIEQIDNALNKLQ